MRFFSILVFYMLMGFYVAYTKVDIESFYDWHLLLLYPALPFEAHDLFLIDQIIGLGYSL